MGEEKITPEIQQHRDVRDWYNTNPDGVKKVAEWISPFSQYDYSIYEEDEGENI